MTTINERIRTIIDVLYRGNVTGFANSIGYGASTIHSIVGKKQSVPTFSVLDKIYTDSRKHGVSAHWLLTGEGEMIEEDLTTCRQVELSKKINEIRESLGLNISEFAKRVNISQGNMSAMLNNKRVIGEGVINKICMEIGIEKEYFNDDCERASNKVLDDDFALLFISNSKLKSIAKDFLEKVLK